jgi:uncharacterized protein HemX
MDYNENKVEPEVVPTANADTTTDTKPTASTVRRTITAALVLVAALLLGYVLYSLLFAPGA